MIHTNYPPGSMETAFQVSLGPNLFRGVVIHGGHRHGYGAVPPEVILETVVIEDADGEREVDFEGWIAAHPKTLRERQQMIAELEAEAIAKVVTPRDHEDELAWRGDYERDARKDEG